jgi:RimJ/RimL family protein N-acetyltransferase
VGLITTPIYETGKDSMTLDLTNTTIETARLTIRSAQLANASDLAALMEPEISQWVAVWPYPLEEEQARKIISSNLKQAAENHAFAATVSERNTNLTIGWLKIDMAEAPEGSAELGYWIGRSFHRRGYALELSRAAIEFAFQSLHCTSVIAGAQVSNEASLSLLKKLGMQKSHRQDVWAPARERFELGEFWKINSSSCVSRNETANT